MNSPLILQIESLGAQGVGIARHQGKVVFVEGALPQEEVAVRVVQEKRDFARAQLETVRLASPLRVEPACPYYGKCGGCNLQHLHPDSQGEVKAAVARDQWRRIAGVDPGPIPVTESPPWEYRRRVRFQRSPKGIGFLRRSSHAVLSVADCPVLVPSLRAGLQQGTWNTISGRGREIMLLDSGSGSVSTALDGRCRDDGVAIAVGEGVLRADAAVFFQGNAPLLPLLVDAVVQTLPSTVEMAVELYAGVGTFGAFLAPHCRRLIAVEREARCLHFARTNLGPAVEFVTGDAGQWLAEHRDRVDYLLVDPPREGLDTTALQALAQCRPRRLVYVSCNPATLARDSKSLIAAQYQLKSLRAFDLYPQTDHLEMISVWDL